MSPLHFGLKMSIISAPLGGLEPPTFRLTAQRASQLHHRGYMLHVFYFMLLLSFQIQLKKEQYRFLSRKKTLSFFEYINNYLTYCMDIIPKKVTEHE